MHTRHRPIGFVGIGLPFLGVPQLLIRYMSARDEAELTKAELSEVATALSGGLYFEIGEVMISSRFAESRCPCHP